jgi:predicted Zn-dependent peptidase
MIDQSQLKNGLQVLYIPKDEALATLVGFIVPAGQFLEKSVFSEGTTTLLERMLLTGTEKYPSPRHLSLYLETLGGRLHTFVGWEYSQVFIEVPYYNQNKAVSLMAEIIQRANLDSIYLEREKRRLSEAMFSSRNAAFNQEGREFLLEKFYLGEIDNTVAISAGAPMEAFSKITKDDLINYQAHQFNPSKSFLVVSGHIEGNNMKEIVEQEWGGWNPRCKKFFDPIEFRNVEQTEFPSITYRQKGSYYTEISLGLKVEDDPYKSLTDTETGELLDEVMLEDAKANYLHRMACLMILNNILGQGASSRLWTKGVEEEMTFAHIMSDILASRHSVFLLLSGLTENSQFTFGLEVMLEILEALRKTTVSVNELSKAKEWLKGQLFLQEDNLLEKTLWAVDNFINTSGLSFEIEEVVEALNSVQPSEIRNLAIETFTPYKLAVYISGTAKETKMVDKLIQKHLNG